MKLPFRFIAIFLAGLAMPALANDKPPEKAPGKSASPSLSDLGHSFKNALTEEETSLVIEYMRDSVLAAFKDEEVTLPPDLAFKLEVLMQRLKKESNYYLDNLMKQLEADIKRSLKKKMEVPPPTPYTPPPLPQLLPAMKAPPPAAAMVPGAIPPPDFVPPPGFVKTPWGYLPWFFVPQPNYETPAYTPPEPPRFVPPPANKPN